VLLRLVNRNPRIAPGLDLTRIGMINDFISVYDGTTFIGMNGRDTDLHIACGVRTGTVPVYALRHDPDLVLLRHLRHRHLEISLPRQRERSQRGNARENQSGYRYTSHRFLL